MSLSRVLKAFNDYKTFVICSHVNPDPDALASQIALGLYLEQKGKKVYFVAEEAAPERFLFLPGAKKIKALEKTARICYDAMIVTDAGDIGRIGAVQQLLRPDKPVINIDHHITNTAFGDVNYILPDFSSTSEIVYKILKTAKAALTHDLAELLYVGAMTDTGSFRYSNTSALTHKMAAELLRFPIKVNEIYQKIYEQVPLMDIKNFSKIINGFSVLNEGKIICVDLPKNVVKKFSAKFDLRDKIFGYLRTIQGVEVLVIFTEDKKNVTRVNFRSQGPVDVARIAAIFHGGGHRKASGCVIEGDIASAHRKVLAEVRKNLY